KKRFIRYPKKTAKLKPGTTKPPVQPSYVRLKRTATTKPGTTAGLKPCTTKPARLGRRPLQLLYNLERAASLGDFILGGGAESVSVHGELIFQFAITQNFYLLLGADKAVRAKNFRSNGFAGRKHIQILDVDHVKSDAKRAAKSALGNAAVQRHLSALKTAATGISATGLLPFVALTGSSAQLRAHTAAD